MNKRNDDWYFPPELGSGLFPFIVIACIAIMASALLPLLAQLKTSKIGPLYGIGVGAALLGAILLFIARLPLYKQRRYLTFGPGQLDRAHRRIYWLSYIFILAGLLILGVVWLRAHEN